MPPQNIVLLLKFASASIHWICGNLHQNGWIGVGFESSPNIKALLHSYLKLGLLWSAVIVVDGSSYLFL